MAFPIRSVWPTVAVQYSQESRQARTKPSSVAPAKLTTEVSAARPSRRNTKYSRNTAGVSFSAIATPSRIPRGNGVRRGTQSAITRVISTTLICPNAKLARMGSSVVTDSATIPTASHQLRPAATSKRSSTIQIDTTSSSRVTTVIATLATGSPTRASGLKTMAASGG